MPVSDSPSRSLDGRLASGSAEKSLQPPDSVTDASGTYLGLAGFAISLLIVQRFHPSPVVEIIAILGLTAIPMLAVDFLFFKVYRRSSTGLDWVRGADFSLRRSAVKLLGLGATMSVLAFAYWVFPEYHDKSYAVVYEFFRALLPYFIVVAPIYLFLVDAYMAEPRDGYWQAGCILIGRVGEVDAKVFGQYCLGWLVKGFFIPFMISVFVANMDNVFASGFLSGKGGFAAFYDFCFALLYAIDMAFGALGYLLTLRIADTHLRSTEPTVFGWVIALVCYPPFWPQIYDRFLPYDAHAVYWGGWLGAGSLLYPIWGVMILCCIAVYAWATVVFGCRFSNLTHRGILTNGPFRWTKHPAYISKNLSWWLVTVPFVANSSGFDALRACLMLGVVNLIYFFRAKTEERHLSRDPSYVAYALWMNENGILKLLGSVVPALRYRRPASRQDNSGALPPAAR